MNSTSRSLMLSLLAVAVSACGLGGPAARDAGVSSGNGGGWGAGGGGRASGGSAGGGSGGSVGGGSGGGGGSMLCAWVAIETRVCPNPPSRRDSSQGFCEAVAAGTDCRAKLPVDTGWTATGNGCEMMTRYRLSQVHQERSAPVEGTCAQWHDFFNAVTECFGQLAGCGANETCVQGLCYCGTARFSSADRAAGVVSCQGDDVVTTSKVCSSAQVLMSQVTVDTTCDSSSGLRCVESDGSAQCEGSPPPPPP